LYRIVLKKNYISQTACSTTLTIFGQYASRGTHCYTELAVSSPSVAKTTAVLNSPTQCTRV